MSEPWRKYDSFWNEKRTYLLTQIIKDYPELNNRQVAIVFLKVADSQTTENAVKHKVRSLRVCHEPIPDALFSDFMTTKEIEMVYGIKQQSLRSYIRDKKVPAIPDVNDNYLIDITVADLLNDCRLPSRQIDWELFQTELKEMQSCLK